MVLAAYSGPTAGNGPEENESAKLLFGPPIGPLAAT